MGKFLAFISPMGEKNSSISKFPYLKLNKPLEFPLPSLTAPKVTPNSSAESCAGSVLPSTITWATGRLGDAPPAWTKNKHSTALFTAPPPQPSPSGSFWGPTWSHWSIWFTMKHHGETPPQVYPGKLHKLGTNSLPLTHSPSSRNPKHPGARTSPATAAARSTRTRAPGTP